MRNYTLFFLLCCLLATSTSFSQTIKLEKKVAKAMKKADSKAIKAHIDYLADDKLLGRKPGTPGYQMAVDYVIDQYKKTGVAPAGENNTYLQTVRLRQATTGAGASITAINAKGEQTALHIGNDAVIYPNPVLQNVTIEAPLVFAGYGISAPDLGYDDYAGIDAKGKIVVVFRGAPEKFESTVAAYNMDQSNTLRNAVLHGAVGVIVVAPNEKAKLPNLQKGVYSVMTPDGKVGASRTYVSDNIKLLANLSYNTLQQFFKQSNLDLAKAQESIKAGKPASAALQASIKATYTSGYHDFESYNVVGKITGSNPQLKDEYVVHSAHLDHVGIGTPVNGDSIYNGAHDNASGVASLLEIARIYNHVKEKPKRSVLLVMVTAEEMGLLGSAYFANYPTVPSDKMIANVNTDMPAIIAPLLSVVALGAQHSSLANQVAQASAYMGLGVEEDPEPDQNRFIRSDQYSFVVQGVPALHIKYGNKTKDGKNNLDETVKKWREEYYHKPQDGPNGIFDYDAGKKYAQLNFLIGYLVAQQNERPTWNQNDFFGTRAVQ
ncbi:M20/M25/M40 family metallo-hydrolase [Pontibacter sp. KCTC 32443]|uniref:M28 family peptidase n=1 Tax=Pontibacter TaxID=323449 RepID=UPI00164D4F1F|nr:MULTISPECIES: M28 family peptidase [Pontibacter]MBC5772687.1 M20/M25/M40 family metallo-hydrolase [Pontibacter sp. KCTC 32443]